MLKPYLLHEHEYRRMKSEGIASWAERNSASEVDEGYERFLLDALAQAWAPKAGKVLEIGCGTGPMLRWFGRRGFTGVGIDVSRTAIGMARTQTDKLGMRGLRFLRGDFGALGGRRLPKFEICLDGLCLHCITGLEDRRAFFAKVRDLLKPGGILIIMTMCGPVDRVAFERYYPGQLYREHKIYVPYKEGEQYEGFRMLKGKGHVPIRHVAPWKVILAEIRQAGFHPQLIRMNQGTREEPCGSLGVCAVARG